MIASASRAAKPASGRRLPIGADDGVRIAGHAAMLLAPEETGGV